MDAPAGSVEQPAEQQSAAALLHTVAVQRPAAELAQLLLVLRTSGRSPHALALLQAAALARPVEEVVQLFRSLHTHHPHATTTAQERRDTIAALHGASRVRPVAEVAHLVLGFQDSGQSALADEVLHAAALGRSVEDVAQLIPMLDDQRRAPAASLAVSVAELPGLSEPEPGAEAVPEPAPQQQVRPRGGGRGLRTPWRGPAAGALVLAAAAQLLAHLPQLVQWPWHFGALCAVAALCAAGAALLARRDTPAVWVLAAIGATAAAFPGGQLALTGTVPAVLGPFTSDEGNSLFAVANAITLLAAGTVLVLALLAVVYRLRPGQTRTARR
ncbi:hypothetical protein [Kitasatospora mediocidica]|uniref:hypothetical protein n=1 Tax=Kitasatospora mediocidica TaxID=58352 RepID=UPI00055C2766|nr:hypothetical protein [Kitasatospora mediocidica]